MNAEQPENHENGEPNDEEGFEGQVTFREFVPDPESPKSLASDPYDRPCGGFPVEVKKPVPPFTPETYRLLRTIAQRTCARDDEYGSNWASLLFTFLPLALKGGNSSLIFPILRDGTGEWIVDQLGGVTLEYYYQAQLQRIGILTQEEWIKILAGFSVRTMESAPNPGWFDSSRRVELFHQVRQVLTSAEEEYRNKVKENAA